MFCELNSKISCKNTDFKATQSECRVGHVLDCRVGHDLLY